MGDEKELREALEQAYSLIDFLRGSLGSDQSHACRAADEWMKEYDETWAVHCDGEEE